MADQLILLLTSPRLPAGVLTAAAWDLVRAHPVYAGSESPLVDAARAAGAAVTVLAGSPTGRATAFRAAAEAGAAVWLTGPDDAAFSRAVAERVAEVGGAEIEVVYGSWDPPGARLLDVVAVLDRLRSPGGCPWTAEQTHESLRPYLLEEAYEAYDALVDGDLEALREELGDVLLQVVFHARVAEEAGADGVAAEAFTVDDVAGDLVAKLVRRHPHVFADTVVSGVDEVHANWEEIKRAEKNRSSVLDGVAHSQPALSLVAQYLSRLTRAELDVDLPPVPPGMEMPADQGALGALLLAVAAAAVPRGLDPEAALRAAAHALAERVRAAEAG